MIIFRVEANDEIGWGHLSRCISISKHLKNFGENFFYIFSSVSYPSKQKIQSININHAFIHGNGFNEELMEITAILKIDISKAILVYDVSYHGIFRHLDNFSKLMQHLRSVSQRLCLIDGLDSNSILMAKEISADCGIVPYPFAEKRKYLDTKLGALHLGPDHFIFSPELLVASKKNIPKRIYKSRRVVLSLGGREDPESYAKLVYILEKSSLANLEVKILGCDEKFHSTRHSIYNVGYVNNIYDYFNWADFCILGGGLTRYEAAMLKCPTVIIARDCDNEYMLKEFCTLGSASYAGVIRKISSHDLLKAINSVMRKPIHDTFLKNCDTSKMVKKIRQ